MTIRQTMEEANRSLDERAPSRKSLLDAVNEYPIPQHNPCRLMRDRSACQG